MPLCKPDPSYNIRPLIPDSPLCLCSLNRGVRDVLCPCRRGLPLFLTVCKLEVCRDRPCFSPAGIFALPRVGRLFVRASFFSGALHVLDLLRGVLDLLMACCLKFVRLGLSLLSAENILGDLPGFLIELGLFEMRFTSACRAGVPPFLSEKLPRFLFCLACIVLVSFQQSGT